MNEKKTVLYDKHVEAGGKMVPFAGYMLPVQYKTGIVAEHMTVRDRAGMFDVSHMGEFIFTGKGAAAFLNMLLSNDYMAMPVNKSRYALMCNREGGIVDDVIVYKLAEERYLMVVNAANTDKDDKWVRENLIGDVEFENASSKYSQIALQGPHAKEILLKLTDESSMLPPKRFMISKDATLKGCPCMISSTGYTGSIGYEIYCLNEYACDIWDMLLENGQVEGLVPCGLGSRDTLRLEACLPLYGHELSDSITPFESDLVRFVKMEKEDFIGKQALMSKQNPDRIRVAIKILGKSIAREETKLYSGDKYIGYVTSGTYCPYAQGAYAMALIEKAFSTENTSIKADIRGRMTDAVVVSMPVYNI